MKSKLFIKYHQNLDMTGNPYGKFCLKVSNFYASYHMVIKHADRNRHGHYWEK